jgi:hypothetical protein
MMERKASMPEDDLESRWRLRENEWRRKLGRLRLRVEPIEDQLTRYRRVTWVLTALPSFLALVFITLFAIFGRPGIGLVVAAILWLPIVIGAWFDYAILARRARRYLAESSEYCRLKERAMTGTTKKDATSEQV